jgi:segregation and condensation protein B
LLKTLEADYRQRGLRLQWSTDNQVQLTTAPAASTVIERFLGLEVTSRLSQAATEVLAIVAYMQPVTRPQVDQIRGVNSDGALRSLLSKGLIEEVGRLETPGRPILYGTTPDFLQHFGLVRLEEMPPLAEEDNHDSPPTTDARPPPVGRQWSAVRSLNYGTSTKVNGPSWARLAS